MSQYQYLLVALVSPRSVLDLYAEAAATGILEVRHNSLADVSTFTALGLPGTVRGKCRVVGSLIWLKDERRWVVNARNDCTATDLASLIDYGLNVVARHGRYPRYWTRDRAFKHYLNDDGRPRARALVSRRVDEGEECSEMCVSVPNDISALVLA